MEICAKTKAFDSTENSSATGTEILDNVCYYYIIRQTSPPCHSWSYKKVRSLHSRDANVVTDDVRQIFTGT